MYITNITLASKAGTCESLFPTQVVLMAYVTRHRQAVAAELGLALADVYVDKVVCSMRGGSPKTFALTLVQGGRRLQQAPLPTDPALPGFDDAAYRDLDIEIATGFTSPQVAARVAALLASGALPPTLDTAMQGAVVSALPAGSVASVTVRASFIAMALSPPPPAPVPVTVWASSAGSPRYAKGARPSGVQLAADKAVGSPQLKRSMAACKPNNAIAWVPSMARPRRLVVYYNASVVALRDVAGVELSIINVGTKVPALVALELLLGDGSSLAIYEGTPNDPWPACPALNLYEVPAGAVPRRKAGMRVVGVRVVPNQGNVPGKTHLIHVSAARHARMHAYTPRM